MRRNFFDLLAEGLKVSDVLRAALDLLFAVVFVEKMSPGTLAIIETLRRRARMKGLSAPACRRVTVDLEYIKVFCQ